MERLVTEIDNDLSRLGTRKDSERGPPREFEITRDPEVAPLATFVGQLRCARIDEVNAALTVTSTTGRFPV